jgi:hypothetical protein
VAGRRVALAEGWATAVTGAGAREEGCGPGGRGAAVVDGQEVVHRAAACTIAWRGGLGLQLHMLHMHMHMHMHMHSLEAAIS